MFAKRVVQEHVIAAVFSTARNWNQSKDLPTGGWMSKLGHSHTIEYYPALNKRTNSRCMQNVDKSQSLLLSEKSQAQKSTLCMMPYVRHPGTRRANLYW